MVRAAIAENSEWVRTPGGPMKMLPLCAVTFSGLSQVSEFLPRLENCARILLDAGADPNSSWLDPEWGYSLTVLYGAAGLNHSTALTRMMLAAGANPNDNESLYHSLEGKTLWLQLLLENGGDANEESKSLGRPLHYALKRRRSAAHIQMLLDAGADPAAPNPDGVTPYRLALRSGLTDIAAQLLARVPGEAPLSAGEQFLAACARADAESARAVLASHPDLFGKLSDYQFRTLPDLAAEGHWPAVRTMVEVGWPIDVTGGDWRASALNHAVFRGDADMTEWLLAHGADWRAQHGYKDNAIGTLSFACMARASEDGDWLGCAKALLAAGVPKPARDYLFTEDIAKLFVS